KGITRQIILRFPNRMSIADMSRGRGRLGQYPLNSGKFGPLVFGIAGDVFRVSICPPINHLTVIVRQQTSKASLKTIVTMQKSIFIARLFIMESTIRNKRLIEPNELALVVSLPGVMLKQAILPL